MATSIPSPLEGCAKTGLPARWASDTRALVLRFINTMTYFSSLHIGLWARLGLSGGNRLAEIKPIPNQAYQGRTRATPIQSAQIYVTVLRDHPGQDRPPGRRRSLQRSHRLSPRYPSADRQQVAQAIRPGAAPGSGRRTSGRAPRPLFPPASSFRSTLSLVHFPIDWDCLCSARPEAFKKLRRETRFASQPSFPDDDIHTSPSVKANHP